MLHHPPPPPPLEPEPEPEPEALPLEDEDEEEDFRQKGKVFVGNLPLRARKAEVAEFFRQFGPLEKVELVRAHNDPERNAGFCFLYYADAKGEGADAEAAADIRFVATGCAACHCAALGADGRFFTWGRNEKGQLGHGDTLLRNLPTVVSELSKYNIITASVGRNHTLVVTDNGKSFAFGDNKLGQLGMGSLRKGTEVSPAPCLVTEATNAVCGAEFTVWLSSVEGSSILTAGLPQYGQLGHGSDNEYNTKVSSVKLSYDPQPRPKAIATLSGYESREVAEEKWRNFLVITTLLLFMVGYVLYFI